MGRDFAAGIPTPAYLRLRLGYPRGYAQYNGGRSARSHSMAEIVIRVVDVDDCS